MYTRILALFSAIPYSPPATLESLDEEGADNVGLSTLNANLAAHLTNTSLQTERGEAGVRLLDELAGSHVLPLKRLTDGQSQAKVDYDTLTARDIEDLKAQIADVLAETFKAAIDTSVHFQVCMYGCTQKLCHLTIPNLKASSECI